uniref:Uncharacterized protein n=1 Tax=Oryza nivara TaxID=4536 RepID=A0A0E0IY65_ORYNI
MEERGACGCYQSPLCYSYIGRRRRRPRAAAAGPSCGGAEATSRRSSRAKANQEGRRPASAGSEGGGGRAAASSGGLRPAAVGAAASGGGRGDRALPSARFGPSGGRGGGGGELEGSPWLQLPGGWTGGGGDTLPSTRSGRRGGSGASAPPDPAGRGVNDDRRGGSSKWRGSRAVAVTTSPLLDLAGGEVMAAAEPSPLPNLARSSAASLMPVGKTGSEGMS